MFKLTVGLEHLQTGLEIRGNSTPVTFTKAGPTTFDLWSNGPFHTTWSVVSDVDGRTQELRQDAYYVSVLKTPSFTPDTMGNIRQYVLRNDVLKG